MVDEFQALLLLITTVLIVFLVIRVVQRDREEVRPPRPRPPEANRPLPPQR